MADENPLEELHEELEPHESSEHEKRGEELRAIDAKITKLSEDIQSWQTQVSSTLEKTLAESQQSIQSALATLAKPEPVQPQNPPPPLPESENPESVGDDRPAAKTKPKPAGKRLRFL